MKKITKIISTRDQLADLINWMGKFRIDSAIQVDISEHKENRTLEQNKKLWAMLRDVSNQVEWYGNKLTEENWKDIFTAGHKKQTAVPGIDGGFVVLGAHTREMSVKELSDIIEIIYAFGSEHNVRWTE